MAWGYVKSTGGLNLNRFDLLLKKKIEVLKSNFRFFFFIFATCNGIAHAAYWVLARVEKCWNQRHLPPTSDGWICTASLGTIYRCNNVEFRLLKIVFVHGEWSSRHKKPVRIEGFELAWNLLLRSCDKKKNMYIIVNFNCIYTCSKYSNQIEENFEETEMVGSGQPNNAASFRRDKNIAPCSNIKCDRLFFCRRSRYRVAFRVAFNFRRTP